MNIDDFMKEFSPIKIWKEIYEREKYLSKKADLQTAKSVFQGALRNTARARQANTRTRTVQQGILGYCTRTIRRNGPGAIEHRQGRFPYRRHFNPNRPRVMRFVDDDSESDVSSDSVERDMFGNPL